MHIQGGRERSVMLRSSPGAHPLAVFPVLSHAKRGPRISLPFPAGCKKRKLPCTPEIQQSARCVTQSLGYTPFAPGSGLRITRLAWAEQDLATYREQGFGWEEPE